MIKRIKENGCDYKISGCNTCNISSCEDNDIVIQIEEWMEELKELRATSCGYSKEDIELNRTAMYNKAIDDFVKEICKMIVQSENNGNYRFYAVEIKQAIADLAEQLKAGVKNET